MFNVQYILEPCCIQRQLSDLCRAIKGGGTAEFKYYGDLSFTELLPALLERYNKTELLIVAPSVPDTAAEVIAKWARRQWQRMDGSGCFFALQHVTIITSLSASPAVSSWLEKNLFGNRLSVVDAATDEHLVLLHNMAISGFRNMRYGENGTATATTEAEKISALWEKYKTENTASPVFSAPIRGGVVEDRGGVNTPPADDTDLIPITD